MHVQRAPFVDSYLQTTLIYSSYIHIVKISIPKSQIYHNVVHKKEKQNLNKSSQML
jgi:hypothetical protein